MKGYMLSLHSPRWAELNHAYGSAADVAAAKGHHAVAEAVLELSSAQAARAFLEWQLDP